LTWMGNVFRGELGYSITARLPVREAILKYFPATVELALLAVVPVLFIAIWMGFFSAEHKGSISDHALRAVAITGWSIPSFVAGMLLLLLFYGMLPWFPPGRHGISFIPVVRSVQFARYTNMLSVDALLNGKWALFLDSVRHLVLPIITLSYLSWALLMRVARSSLLEELQQDYVTTARSKGLPERAVGRHARRNSMMSITTISGMMVAGLLGGVVITETIFNLPGLGQFMATASLALDTPAVLGVAMLNGVVLVVINLAVDILYTFLDPRVRLD